MPKASENLDSVAIRFAGDSGDGMQLTGTQFTTTTAMLGNDLATFPDYPAEIRAPAGTIAGVSGFQLSFSSNSVLTPGDAADVLVAMNPAALKTSLPELKERGIIIANAEAFSKRNLELAGYDSNPLEDEALTGHYRVVAANISSLAEAAAEPAGVTRKDAQRTKNLFALGMVYWLFNRPLEHTIAWLEGKFGKKAPAIAAANVASLKAGFNYAETAELFESTYVVRPQDKVEPGLYRNISGNEATALGFLAAAELSKLNLFLGSYPITPASDILHELSKHKSLGVTTFQAEDEIAGICSAIGAAYAGAMAITTTSGPGLALKSEAANLALMLELPLVIVNVQRGGPSTGLPTKTEQSDLMQALFGRNGEAPMPVIAATSPGDCFWAAIEATRIAMESMTPVMLLTDGYIGNGMEPFRIPKLSEIPPINVEFATDANAYAPYKRDAKLSRPWAIPGTPGLEHRVGGLEKSEPWGGVSYDPKNHEHMCRQRAAKVAKVAERLPPTEVFGPRSGKLAVVGWGGTFGALRAGTRKAQAEGGDVSHIHLKHLFPFNQDLKGILDGFERILVCELNLGQLALLLKTEHGPKVVQYNKLQGRPFQESEILEVIQTQLKEQ